MYLQVGIVILWFVGRLSSHNEDHFIDKSLQNDNGTWTWITGSKSTNSYGSYGTKFLPSSTNTPGARRNAGTVITNDTIVWLFAGYGYPSSGSTGRLSDLWQFDVQTHLWTWIWGSSLTEEPCNYGKGGVPSMTNSPGNRESMVLWIDSSGNLWMFGGILTCTSGTANEYTSSLWEYDPVTNYWTWRGGNNIGNQCGSSSGKGQTGDPGSRALMGSWFDVKNNIGWMFGGMGYCSTTGAYNNLWKFVVSTKSWYWMTGSSTFNPTGVYGQKGVPAAANTPGGRSSPTTWLDSKNNLWLFGGNYQIGGNNIYGDLWRYNIDSGYWTWMSGSAIPNSQFGDYGEKGVPDLNNIPPMRYYGSGWIDEDDNLWMFGGQIYISPLYSYLNDLWMYNTTSNLWTWISGSNTFNQTGVYGTEGEPSEENQPGARFESTWWKDNKGEFWLMGGYGFPETTGCGYLNDVWRYIQPQQLINPDKNQIIIT